MMQCIAHAIEHLPITHLEIFTLAYTAMNFVIYVFRWNKYLNINWPVQVFRKSAGEEPISERQRLASGENPDGLEAIFNSIAGFQNNDFNLRREDSTMDKPASHSHHEVVKPLLRVWLDW